MLIAVACIAGTACLLKAQPAESGLHDVIHEYAAAHPIEHTISTRPTAGPALIEQQVATVVPELEKAVIAIDLANLQASVDDRVAAHLAFALAAVTREREAALEAVHEERIEALADAERMANELVDRSFERVESMIDASLGRLLPVGAALLAGPFVLGLLAGWVLKRPKHRA